MNTTAAIFFLILGQADGNIGPAYSGFAGGLAVIPSHYENLAACETAGEAARMNNVGLSFLSYTCVPGEVNLPPKFEDSVSKTVPVLFKSQTPPVGAPKCLEVCELPL